MEPNWRRRAGASNDVTTQFRFEHVRAGVPDADALSVHLRCLQSVVAELALPLPLERIAAIVADAAVAAFDASVVAVLRRDEDGTLRAVQAGGLPAVARRRLSEVPAAGPSIIANVARSGRAVYVDAVADGLLSSLLADSSAGTGALAVLPLPPTARPLGVMVVCWPHDRSIGEAERSFLAALAALCSLAFDRLQLSADRSHLRAILRRRRLALGVPGTLLQVGEMEIDVGEQRVLVSGRESSLTPSEIRLLMFLAEEPGRARSRRDILRHLWHTEHIGDTRACDKHISNVRRKIERDPSRPERLVTVRGVGYCLNVPGA